MILLNLRLTVSVVSARGWAKWKEVDSIVDREGSGEGGTSSGSD